MCKKKKKKGRKPEKSQLHMYLCAMHLGRAFLDAQGVMHPHRCALHLVLGEKFIFCLFFKLDRRIKPNFPLLTPK